MENSSTPSTSGSGGNGGDSRDITLGCGTTTTDIGTSASSTSTDATTRAVAEEQQLAMTQQPPPSPITVNVATTTGGNYSVVVDNHHNVEYLKKILSKKLKVAKDRICLLHRERELHEGSLKDNGLMDGSKVILLPSVETGLVAQRPENTVMQALESLNDSQVNDFLSGKTPLNLSMRLGDHMMLIQLQLSTVNPSSNANACRSSRSSRSKNASTSTADINADASTSSTTEANKPSTSQSVEVVPTTSMGSIKSEAGGRVVTYRRKGEIKMSIEQYQNLQNVMKTIAVCHSRSTKQRNFEKINRDTTNNLNLTESPIKSLSDLVSSPIKTTPIKSIPTSSSSSSAAYSSATTNTNVDPTTQSTTDTDITATPTMDSNLTAQPTIQQQSNDINYAKYLPCLCKRLGPASCATNCPVRLKETNDNTQQSTISTQQQPTPSCSNGGTSSVKRHRTSNNPILKSKTRSAQNVSNYRLRRTKSTESITINQHVPHPSDFIAFKPPTGPVLPQQQQQQIVPTKPNPNALFAAETQPEVADTAETPMTPTDTRALAEASRSLTQTLRKLSKEVFTNKVELSEEPLRKRQTGAVIESMKNHGKGIYSGTFSGTLNPALQDRYGRPKRDISTVIHILNDLLSATPQYSRGARISFEPATLHGSSQSSKSRRHHTKHSSTENSCSSKCMKSSSSGASNANCTYGECDGHYNTPTSSKAKSCRCHHQSTSANAASDDVTMDTLCSSCGQLSDEHESGGEKICRKCTNVNLENSKTKSKLDQLRLVMQQKKERREARKAKTAPYGARVVGGGGIGAVVSNVANVNCVNEQAAATTTATATAIATPAEVTPNILVEEVETLA